MQFVQFQIARADTGAILPLPKLYVYLAGTSTLASLFNSSGGSISNPLTGDSNGQVGFAAANGLYDFQATSNDGTYSLPRMIKQQIYDLSTITGGSGGGGIDMSALSTSATPAADLEAAIAAIGTLRGDTFLLPGGTINFERSVFIDRPVVIRGRGNSAHWNDPTAGTRCSFPTGKNGFEFGGDSTTHTFPSGSSGAQRGTISDLTVNQTTGLTSTGTGSYSTASPGIITLAAAGDFVNGQIIAVEGAGPGLVITGKTGSMTSGSNILTVARIFGQNNGVYIGQVVDVAGAGLPAGTRVTGYDVSGNVILSNNATATVSGALLTYYYPLVGKIVSGGGTTTLHLDRSSANNTRSISSTLVRHRDTGIYATATLNLERVSVEGQWGICLFRRGDSGANGNADLGGSRFCEFGNAGWAGIFYQGDDSQINVEIEPNLAGPEIGACDCSLIGNELYGAHMAFNTGVVAAVPGSPLKIFGGYFEQGTSYQGNNASFMIGTYFGLNGNGFSVLEQFGSGFRVGSVTATGPGTFGGELRASLNTYLRSGLHVLGFPGFPYVYAPFPDAGPKTIIAADANRSYLQAYDDLAASWRPLRIQFGSLCEIYVNGGTLACSLTSSGFDLSTGLVYTVAGTQVVGPRRTGWTAGTGTASRGAFAAAAAGTASATYVQAELQGALNRIAALEARLLGLELDARAHGLIN